MGRKNRSLSEPVYSTESNDNIVEVDIFNDDNSDFFYEELEKLLKNIKEKPNLILGILSGINEVVDNILEHSDGASFKVCDRKVYKAGLVSGKLEKCKKHTYLIITILDFGKGIVNTLSQEFDSLLEEDTFLKAFEKNVTRHQKDCPSRGNGLYLIKRLVLASNGSLVCESNELKVEFSSLTPNGCVLKREGSTETTEFTIKISCDKDINIYPIFGKDAFEDFFDLDEEAFNIQMQNFIPLNSHQVGIQIKNIILDKINNSYELIRLDFDSVEIFTDSFIQQVTTILSEKIGFTLFKERIKFSNLNSVLMGMVQEKIYIASLENS